MCHLRPGHWPVLLCQEQPNSLLPPTLDFQKGGVNGWTNSVLFGNLTNFSGMASLKMSCKTEQSVCHKAVTESVIVSYICLLSFPTTLPLSSFLPPCDFTLSIKMLTYEALHVVLVVLENHTKTRVLPLPSQGSSNFSSPASSVFLSILDSWNEDPDQCYFSHFKNKTLDAIWTPFLTPYASFSLPLFPFTILFSTTELLEQLHLTPHLLPFHGPTHFMFLYPPFL